MVKQGKRHIGSTIKPFVYCFAIDYMGMTPCTMVPNLPVTLETENMEPWQPKRGGPGGVRRCAASAAVGGLPAAATTIRPG